MATAAFFYTQNITMNAVRQLTVGTSSASWTIYVGEVDQTKYVPGIYTEPTLDANDPNTYAFSVVTDANEMCAVKINLTSYLPSANFTDVMITVLTNSSATGNWVPAQLYTDASGTTPKSFIDATDATPGDAGYIVQGVSTVAYYLIEVQYTYDKVDYAGPYNTALQYTPIPQPADT